jgi:hypothetical protein
MFLQDAPCRALNSMVRLKIVENKVGTDKGPPLLIARRAKDVLDVLQTEVARSRFQTSSYN